MTEKKKLVRKARTVAPPPVKIIIPKPSELPIPHKKAAALDKLADQLFGEPQKVESDLPKEEPVRPEKKMGLVAEDARSLRIMAEQVLYIWDNAPDGVQELLQPALRYTRDRIQARGLLEAGFIGIKGDAYEMLQAEHWYLYKKPWDKTITCVAYTREGKRCKNKPLLGQSRCAVQGHATELERSRRHASHAHWLQYFKQVLAPINLAAAYTELNTRIDWKAKKNG